MRLLVSTLLSIDFLGNDGMLVKPHRNGSFINGIMHMRVGHEVFLASEAKYFRILSQEKVISGE